MNEPFNLLANPASITVVFDHPEFIIVDKPSGIAVQNESVTLGILPLLCAQLGLPKLWLIHRLDKVTSGLLILGKNAEAAAIFGEIFSKRQIEKFYLAISKQKPLKKQGAIKGDMRKIRDGKWALSKTYEAPALTQFMSKSIVPGLRLFLCKPLTGKTHQIRVMMKSIGSPILGDHLYGKDEAPRCYLHAYGLRFNYNTELIELLCPPSEGEYFMGDSHSLITQEFSKPWALPWPKVTLGGAPNSTQTRQS